MFRDKNETSDGYLCWSCKKGKTIKIQKDKTTPPKTKTKYAEQCKEIMDSKKRKKFGFYSIKVALTNYNTGYSENNAS